MKKKALYAVLAAAVACCAVMAVVDGILRPSYWLKSAIKAALFLLIPLVLSRKWKQIDLRSLFRPQKKGILTALALGIGVYGVILGGYFVVRNFFDFSGIVGNLSQNAGVNKDNFLFVSLYISFMNSFLEEFFFRGFLFLNGKRLGSRGFAYGFSSLLFALYHLAMMTGWFSPVLLLLVLTGLTVGGGLFNWLDEKHGSIYTSWLTHMFANFAINTIGFLLIG